MTYSIGSHSGHGKQSRHSSPWWAWWCVDVARVLCTTGSILYLAYLGRIEGHWAAVSLALVAVPSLLGGLKSWITKPGQS